MDTESYLPPGLPLARLFPRLAQKPMTVSMILFGGLLFLRLPYLTILDSLPLEATQLSLIVYVFGAGTYILTAALLWWERRRLNDFHIDAIALGFILAAPFLEPVTYQIFYHVSSVKAGLGYRWIEALTAIVLLVALLRSRPSLRPVNLTTAVWILLAILIGFGVRVGLDLAIRGIPFYAIPLPGPSPTADVATSIAVQLSRAATYEEPLFRGFLCGYLRKAGWSWPWVIVTQAALFTIGHAYYLFKGPLSSFFLVVPVCALALGLIIWLSRSISATMITHALLNGLH